MKPEHLQDGGIFTASAHFAFAEKLLVPAGYRVHREGDYAAMEIFWAFGGLRGPVELWERICNAAFGERA